MPKDSINYRLRPNKNIERKMLAELLLRLGHMYELRGYQYVGFGSYFFNDFLLFHNRLGISRMVSMEARSDRFKRAEFNRPLRSIEVRGGPAADLLPTVDWRRRAIVWLDYESRFEQQILDDINVVIRNAKPGSVLFATWNVSGLRDAERDRYLAQLQATVEPDLVAKQPGLSDVVEPNRLASVTREALHNFIDTGVRLRNRGQSPGWGLNYDQLVNFRYADGARMATVGGLLRYERDHRRLNRARFGALGFYRSGPQPFVIDAPTLTSREVAELRSQLPPSRARLSLPGVDDDRLQQFATLYRHYPTFAETEL